MTLVDLLQCPVCAADVELQQNISVCRQCGFRFATPQNTAKNCQVHILNAILDYAMEVAKGYAVARSFMHVCIKRFVQPTGTVLDLGCGRKPSYEQYLRRPDVTYIKADGNAVYHPDLLIDMENTFPIKDQSMDTVLLFNVLEHLFDFRFTLAELRRILKPGGTFYLYVPFLIKIHGSPCDYFRYTHFALNNLLTEIGFDDIEIYTDGGVLKYLSEFVNWTSRYWIGYLLLPLYLLLYGIDALLGVATKGNYQKSLPIGYFIVCRTPVAPQ